MAQPQTAGAFFESIVAEYDSRIRRGLPRYDEMLAALTRTLPATATDVLELGCGTGALSLLIAERYPDAHLTLVDASPSMLAVARERVGPASYRATFVESTFEELALREGRWDLIAASMSLHHLADKLPFYRTLRLALRGGGVLAFADELTGATAYTQDLHWNDWLAFARLPGHLSEEEIVGIIEHMHALDHYETLPAQLKLLRGAGFHEVDCAWRSGNYGIFVAVA
jgi:ubiquinone/menaquinone biosynthesis C-methylase UbiE